MKILTLPEEFIKFHNTLMSNAPEGYVPWYFPVIAGNKAPDGLAIYSRGNNGSWKSPHAKLTFEEALERLKAGGNVGLSARADDPLVIIDIDNYYYKQYLPNSLINTSRKRLGWHCFCWAKDKSVKINIPTEHGEVRSCDQYVVCAGSYCKTSYQDIDKEPISENLKEKIMKDPLLGVYTTEILKAPITISFKKLPSFFKEQYHKVREQKVAPALKKQPKKRDGKSSALFDLKITDIVTTLPGKREPHPLHSSDTGMNFSIKDELGHCWRHLVSLNAIQFLCVKAGYLTCQEAGTSHAKGGAGSSAVRGNDGAIFEAWLEAKRSGLIPSDDPIPSRAMVHIAKQQGFVGSNHYGMLPVEVYNKVIAHLEGGE